MERADLPLRNRYYLMRHGESRANEAGLIVSRPENGLRDEFGLSEQGREQVREAALRTQLSRRALIYSSDFARTRETAAIVSSLWGAESYNSTPALRERDFGSWELTSSENYEKVWRADRESWQARTCSPPVRVNGVETPMEVFCRVSRLLALTEYHHEDEDIVLVSHGDTLQILQTGFLELPPHRHREVPHLQTAEIRRIE